MAGPPLCWHGNSGPTSGLRPRLPQVSEALSLVRDILQQLSNRRASLEEDVRSTFEDLHKQLDVRESVLLMELEVTYGLKHKVGVCVCPHRHPLTSPGSPQVLQAQVESLVQAEGDMLSSCSRCEEALGGVASEAGLPPQAAQPPASCQPEENDQLDLLMDTDALRKSIHNLGTVVTTRYAGGPRPPARASSLA